MKRRFLQPFIVAFLLSFSFFNVAAQGVYNYSVDLTKLANDELTVQLLAPPVKANKIIFYMPKIVPGTYINSDFGKFVHNVQAFDKSGKSLPVKALADSNGWSIGSANKLYKITYLVEDTWDAAFKHKVYSMAGTNFEEGKNFSINTCGLFGYIDGMKKLPFEISFTKPSSFYASTGLVPVSSTSNSDVFRCENADRLYDSPIMFCVPDTTVIKVGSTDVLVSVYSPKKLITSKFVAANLEKLLLAAKDYLGGKLPVNKYAFLYYFNGGQQPLKGQGAWEHSYSSFYTMTEKPEQEAIEQIMDFSSHEFFHIVTPLNICSKEIREFNFNKTILSKHLWLYEGSTEYDAHHTQVTQGLITTDEYLKRLSAEITVSRKYYNDTLAFTELSLESADKHASDYGNVYQKGALISACLDIYLLKLSNANYSLRNLKHDLSIKYGPTNYFNDDELFDEITKLTFPEVRAFFSKYVEGTTPLPYETFFGYAGVKFIPKRETSTFTLGGFSAAANKDGSMTIVSISKMNEFGKKMGYNAGDIITSLNNQPVTAENFSQLAAKFTSSAKEGDTVTVQVKRNNQIVTLSAPAIKIVKTEENILEFDANPTEEQFKLRKAWLNLPCTK